MYHSLFTDGGFKEDFSSIQNSVNNYKVKTGTKFLTIAIGASADPKMARVCVGVGGALNF